MRNDLQKRRAGAVEVDAGIAPSPGFVVRVLARVFFEVRANDADALRRVTLLGVRVDVDIEEAFVAERQIVLADLVVLRQVRVVVVFAVPFGKAGLLAGVRGDLAVERHRGLQR